MATLSMVAIILTSLVILGTLALVGAAVFGTMSFAVYNLVSKNASPIKDKKNDNVVNHTATHPSITMPENGAGNPSIGFGVSQR